MVRMSLLTNIFAVWTGWRYQGTHKYFRTPGHCLYKIRKWIITILLYATTVFALSMNL